MIINLVLNYSYLPLEVIETENRSNKSKLYRVKKLILLAHNTELSRQDNLKRN